MNATREPQRHRRLPRRRAREELHQSRCQAWNSQSALSHTIRGLEARLELRLLTRTTRSVSPTEAGERLLNAVGPHFEEIQAELAALGDLRDKPSGNVRITAGLHVTERILWPKLQPMLRKHPDVMSK